MFYRTLSNLSAADSTIISNPNFRYRGNKGRSEVNFNTTIRFSDHDSGRIFWRSEVVLCDFVRVYYVGPYKTGSRSHAESTSYFLFRRKSTPLRIVTWNTENGANTRKFGCCACAQSTSVFCHKRSRLENYMSYPCTKFGEDRLKIESARDYPLHRLRCDQSVTGTRTHGHKWFYSLSNTMYTVSGKKEATVF